MSDGFKDVCCAEYDGFLLLLIFALNADTEDQNPHWNVYREPWEERNGVPVVISSAGSSAIVDILAEDTPRTMWAALLDPRPLFDPIRESLLRCRGSNYII